jgi:hypothetical protein
MLKTVSRVLRFVPDVVASVRTFAAEVAEIHRRQAAEVLTDGESFSAEMLAWFQVVWVRLLERGRDEVEAAEKVYRKELRKETLVRERRDVEAADLYRKLLRMRKTFEAIGRGTATLFLGLDSAISIADPRVLLRYARDFLGTVQSPDFEAPDAMAAADIEDHVEDVSSAVTTLQSTLDELALQQRQTEKALEVKDRVLAAFKKRFTYTARLFEALYVLAGKEFHSSRLRPGSPRTGSGDVPVPVPIEEGDGGTGDEPADAPPSETPPTPPSV